MEGSANRHDCVLKMFPSCQALVANGPCWCCWRWAISALALAFPCKRPSSRTRRRGKDQTPPNMDSCSAFSSSPYFFFGPIFAKIVPIVKPRFMLIAGLFYVGAACVLFGFLNKSPPGATFLSLAIATRIAEGIGTAGIPDCRLLHSRRRVPQFAGNVLLNPANGIRRWSRRWPHGWGLPLSDWRLHGAVPTEEPNEGQKTGDMLKFWGNIGILLDAYCVFCTFVIIGYNAAVLEPHLRQFNLEPYMVGLVFVLNGTVYACTAWIWGKAADKTVRTKELCIVACLLLCASLLLLGPAPFLPFPTAVWTVMLALGLFGLGSGGTIVPSFVGSFRDTLKRGFADDLSTYGLVSSVFTVSHSMGAFVGPTLGGYLLDSVGYRMGTMVLLGNEVLLILALCIYVAVHRKPSEDKEPLLKEVT
ncbi:hypothetical protein MTO96_014940 [Rhipicephalus appendiculatus]